MPSVGNLDVFTVCSSSQGTACVNVCISEHQSSTSFRNDDTISIDQFSCLVIAVICHVLLRVSCFTYCDPSW